jgi:hypothetical protein
MNKRIHNFAKTYKIQDNIERERDGIVYWGSNNLYPQWLNWMYYSCAVHQGIIRGKVFFTISAGMNATTAAGKALIDKFEPHLNAMATSLELADTYYLLCRKDLATKTKIESIKVVPFEWVRVDEDGCFYVSQDWTDKKVEVKKYSNSKDDIYHIFQFKVEPNQYLIGGQGRKLTYNYYPLPPYSGAINSILTDIEIPKYQLSEIINNFSLGTVLSMNNGNILDPNDKRKFEDELIEYATGAENAGGVFITYSNGKDTEPTVVHLNGNQLHERYLALEKSVQDTIMKGHSVVSPSLFGFTTGGSFNQSDLDFGYWIMKENYFKERQKQLLEAVYYVAENLGIADTFEFSDVELPTFGQPTPTVAPVTMAKLDDKTESVLAAFGKCGMQKDTSIVLAAEPFSDEPFKDVFTRQDFATAIELQVLSLIADGNSFEKIAKSLGINPSDLAKIYGRLKDTAQLDEKGLITNKGKLDVIRSNVKKMQILYSYEVKPGYGAEVIAGTRKFCRELIALDRFYTREEIENIGNAFNIDAWRYRGGWYHNPNTGKNEPSCRHFWQSNLTYKA